jgi:hypothetical protein
MQPIPEPMGMQVPAHQHLGPGIAVFNTAHIVAPYFRAVYVGHR